MPVVDAVAAAVVVVVVVAAARPIAAAVALVAGGVPPFAPFVRAGVASGASIGWVKSCHRNRAAVDRMEGLEQLARIEPFLLVPDCENSDLASSGA